MDIVKMTGFFSLHEGDRVFDGNEVKPLSEVKQLVFYPPRDKRERQYFYFLLDKLHFIKTHNDMIERQISKLENLKREIEQRENLTEAEKNMRTLWIRNSIKSWQQKRLENDNYIGIYSAFNSLLERLISNTVETVINEHRSFRQETTERIAERITRLEQD